MKVQADQITIRPFDYSAADYAAVVAVRAAIMPDHTHSVANWKHADQARDPKFLYQRSIIELNGNIIGQVRYSEVPWSHRPGKLAVSVDVHPEQQGCGIGRIAYNWLLAEIAQHNPNTLTVGSREDFSNAIAFLEKEGFKLVMRAPVSELDVAGFSAEAYATLPAKLADQGIRIRTVSELKLSDPNWQHNLWDLKTTIMQDVPTDEEYTKPPFESWVKNQVDHPNFNPDGWFVAEDINSAELPSYVGLSYLWVEPGDDQVETGLTGVKQGYRRLGIATAMKLRAIEFARSIGAKTIETDNEENNSMYALNIALGFRPKPAWVEYKKEL